MFCFNCGKSISNTDKFCGKCGTKAVVKNQPNVEHATKVEVIPQAEILSQETNDAPEIISDINHNKERNYFVRHWQGKLSLVKSYWFNSILLSIIVIGPYTFALDTGWLDGHSNIIFSISFVLLALTVWQLVGIWRSATFYLAEGNSRVWGYLARIAVVFGWLQFISATGEISKSFIEIEKINKNVKLSQSVELETSFRFINDNKEMLVTGGIGTNSAKEFQKVANANPKLSIIHLNNEGGLIQEAYEIYKFIQKKGYNTYTSTQCISACTIMYLGGKERLISKKGKLGFHSASVGDLDGGDYAFINDEIRGIYQESGISGTLISKALSTNANDILYPTHEELIASNAVDFVVDPDNYGNQPIVTILENNKLEEGILKFKSFAALKQYYPHLYKTFFRKLKKFALDGASKATIIKSGTELMQSILPEIIVYASNDGIEKYVRYQFEMFQHFRDKSPESCTAYLFPDKFASPNYSLPEDFIKKGNEAFSDLVTSKGAKYIIDETEQEKQVENASLKVFDEFPELQTLFEEEFKNHKDPKGCTYVIKLFKELWNNPKGHPADVFRFIYSLEE